ncbi:hypothetical protein Nmel_017850, partial [Mimus melanotis]
FFFFFFFSFKFSPPPPPLPPGADGLTQPAAGGEGTRCRLRPLRLLPPPQRRLLIAAASAAPAAAPAAAAPAPVPLRPPPPSPPPRSPPGLQRPRRSRCYGGGGEQGTHAQDGGGGGGGAGRPSGGERRQPAARRGRGLRAPLPPRAGTARPSPVPSHTRAAPSGRPPGAGGDRRAGGPSALPSWFRRGPLLLVAPAVADEAAPGSRGLPAAGDTPAPRLPPHHPRGWGLGARLRPCGPIPGRYLTAESRQATGNEVGLLSQAHLGCLHLAACFFCRRYEVPENALEHRQVTESNSATLPENLGLPQLV